MKYMKKQKKRESGFQQTSLDSFFNSITNSKEEKTSIATNEDSTQNLIPQVYPAKVSESCPQNTNIVQYKPKEKSKLFRRQKGQTSLDQFIRKRSESQKQKQSNHPSQLTLDHFWKKKT